MLKTALFRMFNKDLGTQVFFYGRTATGSAGIY